MRQLRILGIALVCVHGLLWSQVSSANEVYLLQTGYVLPDEDRQLVPGVDQENGGRFVASTIGLVKATNDQGPVLDEEGNPITVVVDPGFTSTPYLVNQALRDAKLTRQDITHVFISHHHPDHTLYAGLFPNATLVDFWATYRGDSWEDHPNNYAIAPGITVRRTPGHTFQDASLDVLTDSGRAVFTHAWWSYSNGEYFPEIDPIGDNQFILDESRELILGAADCIIPGHGAPFANPEKERATCSMVTDLNPSSPPLP